MKKKIVYYSLTGTSKKVAKKLGEKLGLETEEIICKKKYPQKQGFFLYFFGGFAALNKLKDPIDDMDFSLAGYDNIVLVTPLWADLPTPSMNTYLSKADLSGKTVSIVLCRGGSNDAKFYTHMEKILEKKGAKLGVHFTINEADTKGDSFDKMISDIAGKL